MAKYSFILLFISVSFFVKGQKDTTAMILLHEVVVTTQRNPQESTYVPYSINSLTRKSLDDFSSRTTPEALINMNGVFEGEY